MSVSRFLFSQRETQPGSGNHQDGNHVELKSVLWKRYLFNENLLSGKRVQKPGFTNELFAECLNTVSYLYLHVIVMPPTKLWLGIRICTSLYVHPSIRTSVRPYVQPEIVCAQLLLHPLMDCVHTHTQWPTWHEEDSKYLIVWCFTWVMWLLSLFNI